MAKGPQREYTQLTVQEIHGGSNRLDRATKGNFGDSKTLGGGISEMRIDAGPGYRIYYTRWAEIVYLLLVGGDKSTQARDIQRAKTLLKSLFKE